MFFENAANSAVFGPRFPTMPCALVRGPRWMHLTGAQFSRKLASFGFVPPPYLSPLFSVRVWAPVFDKIWPA